MDKSHDAINHPHGYTHGDIECWDALKAMLTPEEWKGHVKATAVQYLWRMDYKGGEEDMKKAVAWLMRYLDGK